MCFCLAQNNVSPTRHHHHHHRRRRSSTPPPSLTRMKSPVNENKNESTHNSKANPSEEETNIRINPNDSSKRRHRWENQEDVNDRERTKATDDSQTKPTQLVSTNIPQTSEDSTVNASKSKWDDDETTTDSLQANQTPSDGQVQAKEEKIASPIVKSPADSTPKKDKSDQNQATSEKAKEKSPSNHTRKEKDSSSTRKHRERRTSSRDRDRDRSRRTSSRDRDRHYSSSHSRYRGRDDYYPRRRYDDRYGSSQRRRYSPPSSSRNRYYDRYKSLNNQNFSLKFFIDLYFF